MGINVELVDFNELYSRSNIEQTIVNGYDLDTIEDIDKLNDLLYVTYDSDHLEVVPSCECGNLSDERHMGEICNNCGTECVTVTDKNLESTLWIGTPLELPTLMNPTVWLLIRNFLTSKGVSILDWLTNPYYRVPQDKQIIEIVKLKELGIKQGYCNFVENFDSIMDILINKKVLKKGTVKQRKEFMEFITMNRNKLFVDKIPIPSKLVFIKENTDLGKYIDASMTSILEAVRTVSSMENAVVPYSQKKRESSIVYVMNRLADYYDDFYNNKLSSRSGWFRNHIYGSRLSFSYRAVIVGLTEKHRYQELHLPWSLSVMMLKHHLLSKLVRRGYTPNKAVSFLMRHVLLYNPLIDELFKELISETKYMGLPTILQRNPSLERGSIVLFYITKIKTDVSINSISISPLVLPAMNGDHDGDELNGFTVLDNKTHDRLARLGPHLYALETNSPRKLSGFLGLPSPTVAMIANFIHNDVGY